MSTTTVVTTANGFQLYHQLGAFLRSSEVSEVKLMAKLPVDLIPRPKTKAELKRRAKALVDYGDWILMPKCFSRRGCGGIGNFNEWLLGSQGGNKTFGDSNGIEVKWSDSKAMISLFHQEVIGGSAILKEMIEKFPTRKTTKQGEARSSLYHTVKAGGPWQIRVNSSHLEVKRCDSDFKVEWLRNTIQNRALKLQQVILLCGQVKGDRVLYDGAYWLDDFQSAEFINAITNHDVRLDFDMFLKPNGTVRARGTKFRLKVEDTDKLWNVRSVLAERSGAPSRKLVLSD